MESTDKTKVENDKLADLRLRVATLDLRFKLIFGYHIFCIIAFVLYLFKAVYGISVITQNVATPIVILCACAVAMIPIVFLMCSAYSKNRKSAVILSLVLLILSALSFRETARHLMLTDIIVTLCCYALVFISLIFHKTKKRQTLIAFALSAIVYCIFCLGIELENVIYPHILLLFCAILNIFAIDFIKEYENLSKIYGFPYFNERFNEQTNEFIPLYSTSDFVSDSPDDVDTQSKSSELDCVYKGSENLMEILKTDNLTDTVCDVPINDKIQVENYTEKLRKQKLSKK